MKINYRINKFTLLIIFLIIAITPLCDRYFKNIIVITAIIWIFQIFPSIFHHLNKDSLKYAFFIIYAFFLRAIGFSTASIGNYIGLTVLIICMISFDYIQIQDEKTIKLIANAGMIIVFLNIISNIYSTIKYPGIQNDVTSSQYFKKQYGYVNVFSTLDTYILIFIILSIIVGYQIYKNIEYKRICMATLCSYVILFDLRRTTGILLFSGIVLICLWKILQNKINKKSKRIIMIGTFILGIIFCFFWKDIWLFIAAYIPEKNIQKRLESLSKLFEFSMSNTNFSGDSFLQRMHMFFLDINYWLSNFKTFFLGNGYHREQLASATTIENAIRNKCGGHSTIGDILAQYGIIGGIFLALMFAHIKKLYIWALEGTKDCNSNVIIFMIVFLITFLTNEIINPNIAVIAFLVLPCYLRTERNKVNGFNHQ